MRKFNTEGDMAASRQLPPSLEQRKARARAARERAEAILRESAARRERESAAGQQRTAHEKTVAKFTELAMQHPTDPLPPKRTEQFVEWRGQKIPLSQTTWQGKKV